VKIWNPPSVGEQVMVVSENGELDTAVVTGSFDFDNHPMPSANPNSIEMHCKDGAVFSYDHSTHKLDIRLPDESTTTLVSGSVNLRANDVNLQCNSYSVACSSYSIDCDSYTLDSKTNDQDGTMVINGTPYLEHNHSGVRSGGSSTGGVNG
ncbi:MAG: phage baseplate assembly protein V, partial [Psychrobacter alimentarius]